MDHRKTFRRKRSRSRQGADVALTDRQCRQVALNSSAMLDVARCPLCNHPMTARQGVPGLPRPFYQCACPPRN